jgi:hypothetical protein
MVMVSGYSEVDSVTWGWIWRELRYIRTGGKETYQPAIFFFCMSNLSLTDFNDNYRLQLTGDDNSWNMRYHHFVTDFTDKVGMVGEKPPTVTDSSDTHP